MLVYRLGETRWVDILDGEGARLYGGRWNHVGVPCIYTCESRALAVLEYSVNTRADEIPRMLSIATIEVPDKFLDNKIPSLPGDWSYSPAPSSTKDHGSALLQSGVHSVIRFPSAVLPQEFNYILNPLHPDSKMFKVVEVRDFVFDVRIKVV